MPDMSPGVSVQAAEVNALNFKIPVDDQYNNQREMFARARAWEDLALRRAHNHEAFDNFVRFNAAQSTSTAEQTGQDTTETAGGAETTANAGVAAGSEAIADALAQLVQTTTALNTVAAGLAAAIAAVQTPKAS